jgi:exopolyphosphatase/pppGpp-phosphohydrolase
MKGKGTAGQTGEASRDALMTSVIDTAEAHGPDAAHSAHVTGLALKLFDALHALHGYGPAERRLLEIAGHLHDIGWSRPEGGKHNKQSARMIAALDIPGLDPPDRGVCALVARYHTRSLPDPERHKRFAALDAERRRLVEWLAGMLRVADGLDCEHDGRVQLLSCRVGKNKIVLRLEGAGEDEEPVAEARRKGELLRRITGMNVVFKC